MNQLKKLTLIAAIAAAATSQAALAKDAGMYISGSIGAAVSGSHTELKGTNSAGTPKFDINTAAVVGLGVGYRINPNWRVEGNISYRREKTNDTITQATRPQNAYLGSPTEAFSLDSKVRTTVLMANVAYDIPNRSKFTPYIKAGIGMARHKTTAHIGIEPNFTIFGIPNGSDYPSGTRNSFAWNVGAGVAYPLSDKLTASLDYQYLDAGKAATATDAFGDRVEVGKVKSHEISVGLRYDF